MQRERSMADGVRKDAAGSAPGGREALFERLARIDAERHFFRRLDPRHSAVHARCGTRTLVVTFEQVEAVLGDGETETMPLGFRLGDAFGWSYLTVLALGPTWFRAPSVVEFFDALTDDEFFDAFDRVIFVGAGLAAHAACAYSVAAPGATVLAFAPQASLDPEFAAFDHRFPEARRLDFTSRYGYAPDMLDAAAEAHIFFDPGIDEDAAHAAQFNRRHIRRHRLWHFGENPAQILDATGALMRLFALVDAGRMTRPEIARVLRERRMSRVYLTRLVETLLRRDRKRLAALVCHVAAERLNRPRFRARRDALAAELAAEGVSLPFAVPAAPAEEARA